jgi:flavin-dependent dehydrogenase
MPSTIEQADAARLSPWDAVVLGAGPAGAIAARQLALQRKRVLLVDKARLPRDKVCGGCLGGAALEALQLLGLGHVPSALGGVTLSTFTLASGGCSARVPVGHRVAISRSAFDEALATEAVHAGVDVLDQTQGILVPQDGSPSRAVKLQRHGERATAHGRVVIIATGLAPLPPDFQSQIERRSLIGVSSIMPDPPCELEQGELLMACGDVGYVGVTAIEGNRFDAAAAVRPGALAAYKSPASAIRHILSSAGVSPDESLFTARWHGTPPLTRHAMPLGTHRCLVVGDAAGYVEPFTGEGIAWAMQSAMLATSLLAGSLAAWDQSIPRRWQRLYNAALSGRQRLCRSLTQLLRVRALRQLAIRGLQQAPAMSRPLVRRLDRPLMTPAAFRLAASTYAR